MIVPLETVGADLGDTFAFGGFRCEATGRSFYCGQAFPLRLLEQPGWSGQVHCPYCKEFHDTARSEGAVRHPAVAADVSEERDGRRTVSFKLPALPPEPAR
jgi:hypothetical protein